MKRKILTVIYIILILLIIKMLYNSIINSVLINNYKEKQYSESQAKALTYINFIQSYVAPYNYGNILYQKGEYEVAIKEYEKALNTLIPKEKECMVRINYALAICKTVQVREKDEESIKQAIEKYNSAIDILTEKGCANKNNIKGHSQEAEQLRKDIQKEIDRLSSLQKNQENKEDDDKDEKDNKKEKKEKESEDKTKKMEKEIQDIKAQATKEQRDVESVFRKYNPRDINMNGKNW